MFAEIVRIARATAGEIGIGVNLLDVVFAGSDFRVTMSATSAKSQPVALRLKEASGRTLADRAGMRSFGFHWGIFLGD